MSVAEFKSEVARSSVSSSLMRYNLVLLKTASEGDAIALSVAAASAWVCPLYLSTSVSFKLSSFRTVIINSPYAPRPIFIATSFSLVIMDAETVKKRVSRSSQE